MPNKASKKQWLVLILSVVILISSGIFLYKNKPEEIKYKEFTQMVKDNEIKEIVILSGENNIHVTKKDGSSFVTANPETDTFKKDMLEQDIDVKSEVSNYSKISSASGIFFNIVVISLIVYFVFSFRNKSQKYNEHNEETVKVKFKDIAGNEEAKNDMEFLVQFLKDPKRYEDMGAKLPKGVVLYGPPGTGKTLMAKAVAGEAGVPFYSAAGSDFIEMYAGLGAKRVRELFAKAKENSPSIIFIDEIDAVGTSRGRGENSGEKDQTINALLSELDGFESNSKVVVIVATNRLEDLDDALIRPGRFDRHVSINLPDYKDRLAILNNYSKNKKVDPNFDFDSLAHITIGFSGAALEALMNEASIIAVNRNSNVIEHRDIDDSYYKITMRGNKKINKWEDENELKLVAYHEAGHAIATKLLTDRHLHKVTIIPSTSGAGGATFSVPKANALISKKELLNNIKMLYAGRAAEEILKGNKDEITSGASEDIQQASGFLDSYFAELGMSEEFGMIKLDDRKLFLKENVALSKKLYEETISLLRENKSLLDELSAQLILKETLTGEQVDEIMNNNKA